MKTPTLLLTFNLLAATSVLSIAAEKNLVYPLPDDEPETHNAKAAEKPETDQRSDPLLQANPYFTPKKPHATDTPLALRYACRMNDLIRRVEIDYLNPDTNVPCEVNYYKDVEMPGTKKVLWSSHSFEGYCEQQAQNLIVQLEGWGWACQPQ